MNSLYATRAKTRSATSRPLMTPTTATVRVSGHGVPIEPGLLHTLVEAVSTAIEERLDASDQLLHEAIDAVAADVAPLRAACYTDVLPGAKIVGRFVGCQCNMSLWDVIYHACAQLCSLAPYSWPSKCHVQVPNSSLECSRHLICTDVSGPFLCQIPISQNVHEFVSGAGRLPGQCACHILLVAVHIWRTLMFYLVFPSAVCHR